MEIFILIYQIKCQPEYHFETEVTQCSEQAPGYILCYLMSPIIFAFSSPQLWQSPVFPLACLSFLFHIKSPVSRNYPKLTTSWG